MYKRPSSNNSNETSTNKSQYQNFEELINLITEQRTISQEQNRVNEKKKRIREYYNIMIQARPPIPYQSSTKLHLHICGPECFPLNFNRMISKGMINEFLPRASKNGLLTVDDDKLLRNIVHVCQYGVLHICFKNATPSEWTPLIDIPTSKCIQVTRHTGDIYCKISGQLIMYAHANPFLPGVPDNKKDEYQIAGRENDDYCGGGIFGAGGDDHGVSYCSSGGDIGTSFDDIMMSRTPVSQHRNCNNNETKRTLQLSSPSLKRGQSTNILSKPQLSKRRLYASKSHQLQSTSPDDKSSDDGVDSKRIELPSSSPSSSLSSVIPTCQPSSFLKLANDISSMNRKNDGVVAIIRKRKFKNHASSSALSSKIMSSSSSAGLSTRKEDSGGRNAIGNPVSSTAGPSGRSRIIKERMHPVGMSDGNKKCKQRRKRPRAKITQLMHEKLNDKLKKKTKDALFNTSVLALVSSKKRKLSELMKDEENHQNQIKNGKSESDGDGDGGDDDKEGSIERKYTQRKKKQRCDDNVENNIGDNKRYTRNKKIESNTTENDDNGHDYPIFIENDHLLFPNERAKILEQLGITNDKYTFRHDGTKGKMQNSNGDRSVLSSSSSSSSSINHRSTLNKINIIDNTNNNNESMFSSSENTDLRTCVRDLLVKLLYSDKRTEIYNASIMIPRDRAEKAVKTKLTTTIKELKKFKKNPRARKPQMIKESLIKESHQKQLLRLAGLGGYDDIVNGCHTVSSSCSINTNNNVCVDSTYELDDRYIGFNSIVGFTIYCNTIRKNTKIERTPKLQINEEFIAYFTDLALMQWFMLSRTPYVNTTSSSLTTVSGYNGRGSNLIKQNFCNNNVTNANKGKLVDDSTLRYKKNNNNNNNTSENDEYLDSNDLTKINVFNNYNHVEYCSNNKCNIDDNNNNDNECDDSNGLIDVITSAKNEEGNPIILLPKIEDKNGIKEEENNDSNAILAASSVTIPLKRSISQQARRNNFGCLTFLGMCLAMLYIMRINNMSVANNNNHNKLVLPYSPYVAKYIPQIKDLEEYNTEYKRRFITRSTDLMKQAYSYLVNKDALSENDIMMIKKLSTREKKSWLDLDLDNV